jgi:hypothetical protein
MMRETSIRSTWRFSYGYHKFSSHPRVTSICTLPPAALKLNNVDHVVGRECKTPCKARPMEILLVANLAGTTQFLGGVGPVPPLKVARASETTVEVI